jgi:hypothetical protein
MSVSSQPVSSPVMVALLMAMATVPLSLPGSWSMAAMSVSMRGQPGWYRPAKGNGTAAGRPASWPGFDSAFIAAPRLAEPEKRQYSRSLCAHAASTPRSASNGGATEACPFATSANSPTSTYGVALRETVSPKRAAAACATLMCGASMTSSRAPSSAAASAPGESVAADTTCSGTPASRAAARKRITRAGDTSEVLSTTMREDACCACAGASRSPSAAHSIQKKKKKKRVTSRPAQAPRPPARTPSCRPSTATRCRPFRRRPAPSRRWP